jgi:hypothetical protein
MRAIICGTTEPYFYNVGVFPVAAKIIKISSYRTHDPSF